MTYKDIQGWFNFEDVYDAAVRDHPSGVFVEVGAWKGKSTAYLANLTKDLPIDLAVVDTWRGSPDDGLEAGADLFDVFMDNMRACGVGDAFLPIQMASVEAAKTFQNGSIEFLFLDGAHDYESMKADLPAWLPKMKPGGTIAGHDYTSDWPGVVKAVDGFFAGRTVETVGSCWRVRL